MPEILSYNNSILFKNGYKLVYGNDTVYNLHLDQAIGGTITANRMSGNRGDVVTLYNNPSAGYSFDNYSVTGSTLTGVQVRFNREDIYVSPSFTHNVYNINLQQTTGGTITSDKSTGYYGDTVTLSNTPAEHYGFRDYSITGATLTGSQFTINESNVTAKANFSAWPIRNVTVQQRTGGTIASNKSTGYDGDVVTLSNTANAGYTFTNYNVTGATLTGNQFAFNGGNVTAQGAFNHNVYTITLSQQTGGTITANKTTGYYGDTITLSNTANVGYTFNSYSITGGVLTGNQFKLTGSNVTIKPNYTHNVYNIVLQPTTGGKINANKTTGYYGDTITLTQTPSADCYFINYDISGATLTGNQFKLVNSDVSVYANYSADYYRGKNVKIGNQIWATEDLNYLPDGMTLYSAFDAHKTTTSSPVTAHCSAYSAYVSNLGSAVIIKCDVINEDIEDYCTYSRVGAIYAASSINNWRVPTSGDWNTLRRFVSNDTQTTNKAGYYLKSTADNGVDRYGFNITGTSNGSTMYVTTTTVIRDPIVFYVNRNYDWLQDQVWYNNVNYYRVRLIKDV